LLRAACSLPLDPCTIAVLLERVRESEALFSLAEEHGVVAHLAAALNSAGNPGVSPFLADALRDRHRSLSLFTLSLTAELFRLLGLFREAGIETAVVKGPVLALRAYGDPAARQYVDLDMLVQHRDIKRAAELVMQAGYDSRVPIDALHAEKIPGEYLFRRPGTKIIFELHTERTFRYFPRPLPIAEFFARATSLKLDGHRVPALSVEDEFVLISIHGAKHFWERLMWVSDIAAMVHNHAEIDWMRVKECAEQVGAVRMVRVALLLAERLLRVPVPEPIKKEVAGDPQVLRLAKQIEAWLPYAGYAAPAVLQRAYFRFLMRGDVFAGAGYLARLSLTTTEEDWAKGGKKPRSAISDMLRRPFRLAGKYRRRGGA
jgi:hypothetical protein